MNKFKLRKMKKQMIKLVGVFILIIVFQAKAQEYDQIVIPLSSPDKTGALKLSLPNGTIKVTGYSGKDVILKVSTEQQKINKGTKDGLMKIPNRSLGITAKESENLVTVSGGYNRDVIMEIQVPTKFDLKLTGHNGGDFTVENITGNIEITNHNAGIAARNISGAAILNSHNGDITATFVSVTPDTPMAFTTWNGDVDITFPPTVKATFKMRSERNDILTDFELNLKDAKTKESGRDEDGVYKISIEEWTVGDVNGGGPEMLFKTYNGDVIIRKKK